MDSSAGASWGADIQNASGPVCLEKDRKLEIHGLLLPIEGGIRSSSFQAGCSCMLALLGQKGKEKVCAGVCRWSLENGLSWRRTAGRYCG